MDQQPVQNNQNCCYPQKHFYAHDGGAVAVIIFFILLFCFAKWGPAINFSTVTQSKGEPMVVSGEGKATAVPDIAKVDAGIQISGSSLTQVQNQADKKSQTLVSALKALGIAEADIKTTSYNVNPQQDYNANPPKITGYKVSVNYEITVRKIDTINDVMTTLTGNGANLVGGVTFDLSDSAKQKAMDAARMDAVNQAKQNAQGLANASGVTLGKVINVTEQDNNPIRPVPMLAVAGGVNDKSIAQPNIQTGTTEVDVVVSLSYEVR